MKNKKVWDYTDLLEQIKVQYKSLSEFAKTAHMPEILLNLKLHNMMQFTIKEMNTIMFYLHINHMQKYFYQEKSK